MSRGNYSLGKRQREAEKAKKKREKAERRRQRREMGPGEVPITTGEELMGDLPTVEEAMQAIEHRAQQPRGSSGPSCRLFVGGLSWDTTDDSLRNAFTQYGDVIEAVVVKDRNTGDSRGFGFVTMQSRRDATKAIEGLNDTELDGRVIVVNVANDRDR